MRILCQNLKKYSSCCLHMLNQITADSAVYRKMTLSFYADYEQEEESISVSALFFKFYVDCVTLNHIKSQTADMTTHHVSDISTSD